MAVYKTKNPTKDGRSYFFRIKYKNVFGVIKDYTSPKYKTKKEAEIEEAKYRIDIGEMSSFSSITFDDVYKEFIEIKKENIKVQTVEKIENLYRHLSSIKDKKINSIDIIVYRKLRSYISSLNFSVDHSNKIQNLFKQIIEYANKYYKTKNDVINYIIPFKNVNEFKKEFQIFTLEEYKKFSNNILKEEYKIFFELLYFTGLRCGEATALTFKDIDFTKKTINITKTLTTKYKSDKWLISTPKTKNSVRVLPVKESVLNGLKIMLNKAKQYNDFKITWFVFGFTRPFAESSIAKEKNKACLLSGLNQIRIHDFRHSFASLMISQGASIVLVSKYLGHSSVSITLDLYSHLYKNELDNLLDKLNKI